LCRYTFTSGIQHHTWRDGTTWDQDDKAGNYEWRTELDHKVENIGQTNIHSLVFEFNRPQEDAPNLFDRGVALWNVSAFPHADSRMPIDNDRLRVLDVRLEANQASGDEKPHSPVILHAFDDWHALFKFAGGVEMEVEVKAGQTFWFAAGLLKFSNRGKESARICIVSLKKTDAKL
jgi:hypothetical protein